jgi:hypothetical protein
MTPSVDQLDRAGSAAVDRRSAVVELAVPQLLDRLDGLLGKLAEMCDTAAAALVPPPGAGESITVAYRRANRLREQRGQAPLSYERQAGSLSEIHAVAGSLRQARRRARQARAALQPHAWSRQ